MKIVQYSDTGKVVIGEVTAEGQHINVSYLQPNIDPHLAHYLADICEKGYVEVMHPKKIDGGIAEMIVEVKPGDKLFWASLNHSTGILGYSLED